MISSAIFQAKAMREALKIISKAMRDPRQYKARTITLKQWKQSHERKIAFKRTDELFRKLTTRKQPDFPPGGMVSFSGSNNGESTVDTNSIRIKLKNIFEGGLYDD